MVNESCLAALATDAVTAVVDGEGARSLRPREVPGYLTSDDIAVDAGIQSDSPRYSGLHNHCQYSRTC